MKSVLRNILSPGLAGQRGTVIILTAILLTVFVGMAALAVDLSHLYVVKNELQNAADAGALAGAWVLYDDSGAFIDEGANQEAYDAATANNAISTEGVIRVDVDWDKDTGNGNMGDVQRGHWSFGLGSLEKGFYANASTTPPNLWEKSTIELDEDVNFINAVRVVTRRDKAVDAGASAASFFAQFFGYDEFSMSADAVAYLGFAGTLKPNDVDLPIALCRESLVNEQGEYSCSYGRMLNSGSDGQQSDHNTGAWTNFMQDDPETEKQDECSAAGTPDVRSLLAIDDATGKCTSSGNPRTLYLGQALGSTGGVADNLFNHPGGQPDITKCWIAGTSDVPLHYDRPAQPWTVTLPVISCPGNQPKSCDDQDPDATPATATQVVGSVTVTILWILEADNVIDDFTYGAPSKMYNPVTGTTWENNDPDGIVRWNSFVDEFKLLIPLGNETFGPAYYSDDPAVPSGFKKKSIYFMPDCTPHEPGGLTGGENYGTLADIPVLVE